MAKALSKSQQKVIDHLGNGWQLGISGFGYRSAWMQKGKVGYGGASEKVNMATFNSLLLAGLISKSGMKYPTTTYDITDAGRAAMSTTTATKENTNE